MSNPTLHQQRMALIGNKAEREKRAAARKAAGVPPKPSSRELWRKVMQKINAERAAGLIE